MSLDSLFQHILLTEKQAQEQRRLIQEVKSDTSSCQKKINHVTENLKEAKTALEAKVYLLSEKRFQSTLLTKRQEGLETQKHALQAEKAEHLATLQQIKKEMADEGDKFLKEIMHFNNEYGLTTDREALIREKAQAETKLLDTEEETLRKGFVMFYEDIESLKGEKSHLNTLQRQRESMEKELAALQLNLKGMRQDDPSVDPMFILDIEEKILDAFATSKCLEAEKFSISQKPHSNAECLSYSFTHSYGFSIVAAVCSHVQPMKPYRWRIGFDVRFVNLFRGTSGPPEKLDIRVLILKRELDCYKEEDLETPYKALCAEIDLLQMVRSP
ncbi:coiled-coil domain-containing protein 172 [Pelodytes ibericus]